MQIFHDPTELPQHEVDTCKIALQRALVALGKSDVFSPLVTQLMAFSYVITNRVPSDAPACVCYQTGEIFINPQSGLIKKYVKECQNNDTTRGEAFRKQQYYIFVFAHEILHVVLKHHKRVKWRDHSLWNIACDHLINLLTHYFDEEHKLTSKCSEDFQFIDLQVGKMEGICFDHSWKNQLEEAIYDELIKQKSYQKDQQFFDFQEFMDYMNGVSDQPPQPKEGGGPGDVQVTTTTHKSNGKTFKHTDVKFPHQKALEGTDKDKSESIEGAGEITKRRLNQSVSRGFQSASLNELLRKLLEVKIDWKEILGDSLRTILEKADHIEWGLPEPVWIPNALTLPYMPTLAKEEKPGKLVISIDESGSMPDADVSKAITICMQSWDHYKGLHVIKHDYNIIWEESYDEKPDNDKLAELATRRSCGGTSHMEVYKRVAEINAESDEPISAFVCITDMYSDMTEAQNHLSESVPVVTITNNDHRPLGVRGRIIQIN